MFSLPTGKACGKVQNGENHRFSYSASRCRHRLVWSAHSVFTIPGPEPENKSAPPWPRHDGRGVGAFLFHSESAIRETRPQKTRHTFITLACRLAVLRTEHLRRSEDLSPSLTVRQPSDCCPRKRHVWGTRQSRWFSWAGGFAVLTQPFCARGHIAQKPIRDHMRARLTSQGR